SIPRAASRRQVQRIMPAALRALMQILPITRVVIGLSGLRPGNSVYGRWRHGPRPASPVARLAERRADVLLLSALHWRGARAAARVRARSSRRRARSRYAGWNARATRRAPAARAPQLRRRPQWKSAHGVAHSWHARRGKKKILGSGQSAHVAQHPDLRAEN